MIDYSNVIITKYPGARLSVFDGDGGNFRLMDFGGIDGRGLEIVLWNLPDPQPTIAELEAYAATPEYQAARAIPLKAAAEVQVNAWANQMVMSLKILEPELFYVAMLSNIAFRLLEWNSLGRPEEVDPLRFVVTHQEAQAYREAHAGRGDPEENMTPFDLLQLQESRWSQMQQAFAAIVYKRRLALEKIKLAQPGETLEANLAAILAEMEAGFAGQLQP